MKVIVYTKADCFESKLLEKYLKTRGVPFIRKDAFKHEEELYQTGFDSTPVIAIDKGAYTKAIQGFDEDIAQYLGALLGK